MLEPFSAGGPVFGRLLSERRARRGAAGARELHGGRRGDAGAARGAGRGDVAARSARGVAREVGGGALPHLRVRAARFGRGRRGEARRPRRAGGRAAARRAPLHALALRSRRAHAARAGRWSGRGAAHALGRRAGRVGGRIGRHLLRAAHTGPTRPDPRPPSPPAPREGATARGSAAGRARSEGLGWRRNCWSKRTLSQIWTRATVREGRAAGRAAGREGRAWKARTRTRCGKLARWGSPCLAARSAAPVPRAPRISSPSPSPSRPAL